MSDNPKPHQLLHALFTSRVRLKILNIFIPHPDKMYYVRQVTRMTGEEVNAVRRELERMRDIGLLATEERGNRLYYSIKKDFVFYYELLRMVGKITGMGYEIIKARDELGKLKYASLSLRFVQGVKSESDTIDMVIVGKVELERLQNIVRQYEDSTEGELNYTVLNEEEFEYRKTKGDAFIRTILSQPQILLIGDESGFYN